MNVLHSALIVIICSAVTILLRFTPFILFRSGSTPPVIQYLGTVLPGALIGMLVIYCLKDIDLLHAPFALPELISGAVVVALQWYKKSPLLSIVGGTVCYMLLTQLVF